MTPMVARRPGGWLRMRSATGDGAGMEPVARVDDVRICTGGGRVAATSSRSRAPMASPSSPRWLA